MPHEDLEAFAAHMREKEMDYLKTHPDWSPVPGHFNEVTGGFCSREGQMAPGGRCPDGCDHADHYSNDGHPECEDMPEVGARCPHGTVESANVRCRECNRERAT